MSSPLPIRAWPPTITHVDWNNLVRYGLINCYASAPSFPYVNQMYVDTDDNTLYRYNGTSWVGVGNGGTGSFKVDNILPWHNNYINFKADLVLFGNLIFTGSRLATSMNPLGSGIALGSPSEAYLGVVAKTLYASELQFTGSALSGSVTIKSPLIFPDMGMIITITGSDHWVVPKPGYTPTNHYSYLYVSTISPEDNTTVLTDPVLSTNQAFFVQKDFQTHGFVGSSSDPKKGYGGGAILMGQGFTGYYCPPQFSLTGVMIDMDDVLGEYAKGTVLPAQPSGSQWFYRTDTKVLWRYLNGWQAKYPNVQSSYYDTLFLIRGDTENPANLYINGLNVNSIYPQYNTWVDLWAKLNIHGNFQLSGSVVSSLNPSGSNLALGSSTEQWSGSCIKNNWCDAIRPLNNTWVEVRSKLNIYGDLQLTNGRVVSSLNPTGSIALGGPDEQWYGVTAKDVYCNDITPIPADKGGNGTWVDVNSKLNIHGDLQLTGGRVASALNPTGSLGLGGPGEAWTGLYATTVYTDNLKKLDNTSWNLTGSDKYYVNSLYPFTNGTWIDVQSKLNIHGDLQITGGHVVSALNPSGNIALGSGTEKWTGISVLTTYTNTLSALDNTWITCNTKLNLTGDFQLNGRVVTSLNPTGSVALGSGDEPWSGVAATTVYTNNFKHLDNTAWVFTGSDKYYVNSLYPYTNGTWIDVQTKLNIHGDLQLTGGHVVSSLNPSGAVALGGGSEKWTGVTALKAYINSIELLDNTWVDCNAKLNVNGNFQLSGRVVSSLNPTGSVALGSGDEPWSGVTATTVYTNNIKHIDNTSWVFTGSDKYYLNSLYPLNNSWIDVQTKLNIHGDLQITNGHVVSSLNPSGDVALGGGTEKWSGVTALTAYINTLDNLDNEWINVNAKLVINGDLQLNNGKVASSLNPRTSNLALGGGSEKWLGVTALTAYINTLDNLDNTWIDVNAKLKVNGDLQFSGTFTAPSGSIDWSCLANTPTAYITSVVSPLSVTSGSLSFTKVADLATIWTKATKIAFTDIATGTTPTSWTIAWSQIASGIPVYVSSTPTFTGVSMSGNIIPTVAGSPSTGFYNGSTNFPWQAVNTYGLATNSLNTVSGTTITIGATLAFGNVPFTISSSALIANLHAANSDSLGGVAASGYITTSWKGSTSVNTLGTVKTGSWQASQITCGYLNLNSTAGTKTSDLGNIWSKATKIAFGDITTGSTPTSWTIAWSQIASGIPVYVSANPTFNGITISNGADTSAIAINGSHALEISNLSVMVDKSLTCGDGTNGLSVSGNAGVSGTLNVNKLTLNSASGTNGQVLTSKGANVAPEWTTVTVPRIDKGSASTNASGVATVTFGTAFSSAPTVVCTPTSGGTVSLVITGVSTTGFTVKATQYNEHKHLVLQISNPSTFSPTLSDESTHTHTFSGSFTLSNDSHYHTVSGSNGNQDTNHAHGAGLNLITGDNRQSHNHSLSAISLSSEGHYHTAGGSVDYAGASHGHSITNVFADTAGGYVSFGVSGNTNNAEASHGHGITNVFADTAGGNKSFTISGNTANAEASHGHGITQIYADNAGGSKTTANGGGSHNHSVSNVSTTTGTTSGHYHSSYYAYGWTGNTTDSHTHTVDIDHVHQVGGSLDGAACSHSHAITNLAGSINIDHVHAVGGSLDGAACSHAHGVSLGGTVNINHVHAVGGSLDGADCWHTHGFTGGDTDSKSHTHSLVSATIGNESAVHDHAVGGYTAIQDIGHSHPFTNGGTNSYNHTHIVSGNGTIGTPTSHTHTISNYKARAVDGYNVSGTLTNIGSTLLPSSDTSTATSLYTKPSGFDANSTSITNVAISFNWIAV